ncbi:paladin-like isoform X1 [Mytilus galloprovincialis]|uniref:paladin-like isoform X1 n=2 Tax=Mytilus galloprovincialis TaxID=29158 RepID=UPI003F7C4B8D
MGSGASTLTPPSSPEPESPVTVRRHARSSQAVNQNNRHLVRTNEVAPIIIHNCREEFQHVSDFKEPIVFGSIADNMPEHALIKGKYFLVKDIPQKTDRKYEFYRAPNFRKACPNLPVWACGQPTERGLSTILDSLSNEGFTDILLFNLREEPVLFVDSGSDMLPYTIKDRDNLESLVLLGRSPQEADEAEARVRKEVIDLAILNDKNKFYFYGDIENPQKELRELTVQYEDNLLVSEEVYSRHMLCSHSVRFKRLCFPLEASPTDEDIDDFLNVFKECPKFFEKSKSCNPGLLFTCNSGQDRATVGSIMGCLVLAQKYGFPQDLKSQHQSSKKFNSLQKGDYYSVQKLVRIIPNGVHIKNQVDQLIDHCSDYCHLRILIYDLVQKLERIERNGSQKTNDLIDRLFTRCCHLLERYVFLICFNAYLTEQFPQWFSLSFSQWMQRQPGLTRIRGNVGSPDIQVPVDLLFTGQHYLVADEYIGLDVLSTQSDVMVSNFRRINIKGFPIYGMAQPARHGVTKVTNHLLSRKVGHTFLVLINLRNDCSIELDGNTYSIRDSSWLEEPITHPLLHSQELEEKGEEIKKAIKTHRSVEVYHELSEPSEVIEVSSILTPQELALQQKLQTLDMQYYRVPLTHDMRPCEQDFDDISSVICEHCLKNQPINNTAFLFYCRTGKNRTTLAMAIAGLIMCHIQGFPKGANIGEQERVSCPNAQYTKGDFMIVQKLVRLLPKGQQIKREVDFILDEIFETMSPMHFHIREVIFVIYNKIKNAKNDEDKQHLKQQSIDALERYLYLIMFNAYLHHDKKIQWSRSFSEWMKKVAVKIGVYQLLDNLGFYDFEKVPTSFKTMKERWCNRGQNLPFQGSFV